MNSKHVLLFKTISPWRRIPSRRHHLGCIVAESSDLFKFRSMIAFSSIPPSFKGLPQPPDNQRGQPFYEDPVLKFYREAQIFGDKSREQPKYAEQFKRDDLGDDGFFSPHLKLGIIGLGAFWAYKASRVYRAMTPEERKTATFIDIQTRVFTPAYLWKIHQKPQEDDGSSVGATVDETLGGKRNDVDTSNVGAQRAEQFREEKKSRSQIAQSRSTEDCNVQDDEDLRTRRPQVDREKLSQAPEFREQMRGMEQVGNNRNVVVMTTVDEDENHTKDSIEEDHERITSERTEIIETLEEEIEGIAVDRERICKRESEEEEEDSAKNEIISASSTNSGSHNETLHSVAKAEAKNNEIESGHDDPLDAEEEKYDSDVSDIGIFFSEDEKLTSEQENALKELLDAFGINKVVLDRDCREERMKDDWSYHKGKIPLAIVYPDSTEDVSRLLKICSKYRVPVVPFGCGTSLEGHTISIEKGIICNVSKMDKIVEVHEKDADVVVQTGIQWMELNEKLEKTGFFFPMDPGPGAAIAGMIGTCCSGTNAVKYGVMKDWVLSITVVLANGQVVKLGSRARKDVAGYDLIRLFVGAEGTLGIVTEATLKLAPRPEHHLVAVSSFPTTKDACASVAEITRKGIAVSGAEYLDPLSIKIVTAQGKFNFQEKPTIMFKFSGTSGQLQEAAVATRQICNQYHGEDFQYLSTYETPEEVDHLWSARKDLLFNAIAWSQGRESWITDVCVPIGELPNVLQDTIDDIRNSPLDAPVFGHVGDGNFHAAILFNPNSQTDRAEAERLNERMIQRAIAVEGTCTGEHGIGEGKKKYLVQQLKPESLSLMKLLKRTLDPLNILNPGKIFDLEEKSVSAVVPSGTPSEEGSYNFSE